MAGMDGLSKMAKTFSPAYMLKRGVANKEMPALSPLSMMKDGPPSMLGMSGMADMMMGKKGKGKPKPTLAGGY